MDTLEWTKGDSWGATTAELGDSCAYVIELKCWHVWAGPRGGKQWLPLIDLSRCKTIEEAKLRIEEYHAKKIKAEEAKRTKAVRPEAAATL